MKHADFRMVVGGWLLCCLGLSSGPAAAGGEAYQAVQLYRALEYTKALQAAQAALKLPIQEPAELVSIYRIQGLCQSALGKHERALESFRELLSIDPSFRMSPDVSPKLAAPFFQALAMSREQAGIRLSHPSPEAGASLGGLILRATLESDPFALVKTIRLRFRPDAEAREKQMVARVEDLKTVAMKLPADLQARKLSYYFEAVNQHGAVLHRLGSRSQPRILEAKPLRVAAPVPVRPQPERVVAATAQVAVHQPDRDETRSPAAWYQTWWFWSAVGAAVAGVTTAAILASGSGDGNQPVDYGVRIR